MVRGPIVPALYSADNDLQFRYLLALEHKTHGRQLHLAKRFGPKRAFFSCKNGYKINHETFC